MNVEAYEWQLEQTTDLAGFLKDMPVRFQGWELFSVVSGTTKLFGSGTMVFAVVLRKDKKK